MTGRLAVQARAECRRCRTEANLLESPRGRHVDDLFSILDKDKKAERPTTKRELGTRKDQESGCRRASESSRLLEGTDLIN